MKRGRVFYFKPEAPSPSDSAVPGTLQGGPVTPLANSRASEGSHRRGPALVWLLQDRRPLGQV